MLMQEFEYELEQALQELQVQKMPPIVVQPCPSTSRPIVRVIRGFATGKSNLTLAQRGEVRQLALMIVRSFNKGCQPIRNIRIIGHTDDTGSDAVNINVGRKRAIAVRSEMKGVVDSILTVSSIMSGIPLPTFAPPASPGESQPAVPNTSAANRAQNRRVVVLLD